MTRFVGENGTEWKVGPPLAYQGCDNAGPLCSQIDGRCVGWHCSYCNAPCSSQGHHCDVSQTLLAEAERIEGES